MECNWAPHLCEERLGTHLNSELGTHLSGVKLSTVE
jgi:hypothetical protein